MGSDPLGQSRWGQSQTTLTPTLRTLIPHSLDLRPEPSLRVAGPTEWARLVPIATAQYPSNWELAAGRALTVMKTMIESGMPAARISAASYGDQRPVKSNDTPEGKAANRRIEIVLVPDLSGLPGFDELIKASNAPTP